VSDPIDLEAVLQEIRATAAEARESGVYPDGLEEQLQSDFGRQLARHDTAGQRERRVNTLRNQLHAVERARHYGADKVASTSSVPGGELVHKAAAKAVNRQVNGIYDQLRQFSDNLFPLLTQLVEAIEDPTAHVHDDLVGDLDVLQDRVGELQRTLDTLGVAFRDSASVLARLLGHLDNFDGLGARIATIEETERRRRFDPFFDYGKFEDMGRGDEADLENEYAELAKLLAATPGPVLDIGAGRGEMIRLLEKLGKETWGVELDEALALKAAEAGLPIEHGDGIEALRKQPFGSLGGIVLLHVIEHLTPNELLEVVQLSFDRLARGGLLVMETPNPQSLYIFARAFWLDPTHTKPVHPQYLQFVAEQAGFESIKFEWTGDPGSEEVLIEPPPGLDGELASIVAENARRTNQLVFGPQNYRIVLRR
jgi:SAM-dependent methyltransferase